MTSAAMHSLTFYKVLSGGLGALLALVLVLTGVLLFRAKRELDQWRERESELSAQLARIELELLKKQDYLWRLENDDAFLEREIRQRLGYARPGEMVYRFDVDALTADPIPGATLTAPSRRNTAPQRNSAPPRPAPPAATARNTAASTRRN